jgi:hypothetical protein
MKTSIAIFCLYLISYGLNAQSYYGINNFGKIEFLNDSMYQIYCAMDFGIDEFYQYPDTGYYRNQDDTIWLSSKIKIPYQLYRFEEKQSVDSVFPVFLKRYVYDCNENLYKLEQESCSGILDENRPLIVFNDQHVNKNDLLVFLWGIEYERLIWEEEDTNFFAIQYIDTLHTVHRRIYFNEFPLVKRKKKLIPIDEKKVQQCWIENGFYFPIMKKRKGRKDFATLARWSMGMQGLPDKDQASGASPCL